MIVRVKFAIAQRKSTFASIPVGACACRLIIDAATVKPSRAEILAYAYRDL